MGNCEAVIQVIVGKLQTFPQSWHFHKMKWFTVHRCDSIIQLWDKLLNSIGISNKASEASAYFYYPTIHLSSTPDTSDLIAARVAPSIFYFVS